MRESKFFPKIDYWLYLLLKKLNSLRVRSAYYLSLHPQHLAESGLVIFIELQGKIYLFSVMVSHSVGIHFSKKKMAWAIIHIPSNFKVNDLVGFSIFTKLCNCYHCVIPEPFYYPWKKSSTLSSNSPFPLPPAPSISHSSFCLYRFASCRHFIKVVLNNEAFCD